MIFVLILIALTVFIFIQNTIHGLYFVLGITLFFVLEKMYNKYAMRHDQRADELKQELKK